MGSPCTLLLLAAGMGSRYGGLKQLDPVGPDGSTLMDYSVFDACRAGFSRVVFVIREEMQNAFESEIASKYRRHLPVAYVHQRLEDLPAKAAEALSARPDGRKPREKPWGTGHAILAAREAVREPFTAINADDYYGPSAFKHIYNFLSESVDSAKPIPCAMVGYRLGGTLSPHGRVSRGLCRIDEQGRLRTIREVTGLEPFEGAARYSTGRGGWAHVGLDEIVSMNFWGLSASIFEPLAAEMAEFVRMAADPSRDEFYAPTAIQKLIERGIVQVKVLTAEDRWFGVTYREDRDSVAGNLAERIRSGLYPKVLWPSR